MVEIGQLKKPDQKRLHKTLQVASYSVGIQCAIDIACRTLDHLGVDPKAEVIILADEIEPELNDEDPMSLKKIVDDLLRSARSKQKDKFARLQRPPTFLRDEELEPLQIADFFAFLINDHFGPKRHDDLFRDVGRLLSPIRFRNVDCSGIADLTRNQV